MKTCIHVAEFEKPLISMLGYFSNSWISPTQSQISQSLECSLLVLPIGVCVCLSCDELVTYPGCIPCTMCVIGSSGSLPHCLCTCWWVDIRIRLFVFLPSAFLRSSYISLIVLPVRSTSPRPVLSSKNAADIQRKRSSPLKSRVIKTPTHHGVSPLLGCWQPCQPPSPLPSQSRRMTGSCTAIWFKSDWANSTDSHQQSWVSEPPAVSSRRSVSRCVASRCLLHLKQLVSQIVVNVRSIVSGLQPETLQHLLFFSAYNKAARNSGSSPLTTPIIDFKGVVIRCHQNHFWEPERRLLVDPIRRIMKALSGIFLADKRSVFSVARANICPNQDDYD